MSEVWIKCRKKPIIVKFRSVVPNKFPLNAEPYEEIKTLEGIELAYDSLDFIIKGVHGELYAIKKSIFKETYDVIQ